jgi:hypothetical protein
MCPRWSHLSTTKTTCLGWSIRHVQHLVVLVHEVRRDGYAYLGQMDDRLLVLPD